ncbi:hypothetical protein O1M63_50570 [Streptomyces mirabilis]|nr:hypothetical protein [Streptomyces mirabilis]
MRENGAMPASDAIAQPEQPWNRQRLRSTNERLLLDRLRTGGAASRAQLARETGCPADGLQRARGPGGSGAGA